MKNSDKRSTRIVFIKNLILGKAFDYKKERKKEYAREKNAKRLMKEKNIKK